MMLALFWIAAGVVLLLWSAGWLVAGAVTVSRRMGIPALVVGMVVVGFGTSAPEVAVSFFSAMEGKSGLALGNAFGSNITNIALILGLTAWINPIRLRPGLGRRELPLLIAATGLVGLLLWDLDFSRAEAWGMVGVFALMMSWMLFADAGPEDGAGAVERAGVTDTSLNRACWLLLAGLGVLVVSSRLLVAGAVAIAQTLGVSDLVIGLTVVAVGTSLPELASSVVAARRGEHDLVLGNILGSNLFNTLVVAGVAGIVHPSAIDAALLDRDLLWVTVLTVALLGLAWHRRGGGHLRRGDGGILVLAYVAYTVYLVVLAQSTQSQSQL
jgi:cation:H+ antiporter